MREPELFGYDATEPRRVILASGAVMHICPGCGKTYDGDQCWVCVARKEDINETVSLSLPVLGAGIIGVILASGLYPPFAWGVSLTSFVLLGAILIPGAITLVLVNYDVLERFAVIVRLMFVFAAAAPLLLAAFFLLNGALDGNPSVEAQALVSDKYVSQGRSAGPVLVLSVAWNQTRIEETVHVSREKFSAVVPGDSVRLIVHPGAFSRPWSDNALLSNGQDASRLNSR